MKIQFRHLALCLGARSYLILALLLSLGGLLCWRLVRFVLKTEGSTLSEDITPEQTASLMAVLIFLVLLILGWRLIGVNQTIRKTVLHKYREALEQNDPEAEQKVRRFVEDLNIRGTMFHRFNGLIRLVPEPFVVLVGVLGGTCVLTVLTYYWLRPYSLKEGGGFLGDIVFPNSPWAIATFVFAWLVYNDIWVFNELERLIIGITVVPSPGYAEHLEHFQQRLSPAEMAVFQKRFMERHRQKEIADALHIDLSTVKSHINRIYHKMRRYERDKNLRGPLLNSVLPVFLTTQVFS
ncbi:MAG: RNA polymerase sigma factor [Saprospiraceae bacterium]